MSGEGDTNVRLIESYLYGSSRTKAREAAKKLLETDHVTENFQKGVEPPRVEEAFCSETGLSFRHQLPAGPGAGRGPRWSSGSQNTTHVSLGSHPLPLTSVVRSDFTPKPMEKFKLHVPEGLRDINIPDLAPKYMADKSFGDSLYRQDFDGDKAYGVWSSRMARGGQKVGRRRDTTAYQKATHFQLGSEQHSLSSETSCCFTDRSTAGKPLSGTTGGGVAKSGSNVFRPGDYGAPLVTPCEHFVSVQKQDYSARTSDRHAAGVSTATNKGYSHVFPRKPSGEAVGALHKLLIAKNTEEFQNPRDPTAINVTKAFLKFDQSRCGSVSVEQLRAVCSELGTPISEEEVQDVLKECDANGDGRIDYVEFTKYLTAHTEPHSTGPEFVSTHRETFAPDDEGSGDRSAKTEFMGVTYQTSTHFHLGDDSEPPVTIYTKDYEAESARGGRVNQSLQAPPPSSKVMHEFPVVGPASSTSRKTYVRHDTAAKERERLLAMQRNRERHEKLAVVLSSGQATDKDCYQTSIMGSSYTSPASTERTQPVDPAPEDYRHLESDRALPHPYKPVNRTEAQACFGECVESGERVRRARGTLEERTSRIGDNKSTHFVLGFQQPPPQSEKMAEFGQKAPVGPELPAAGRPNGPTCEYSLLRHEGGGEGERPDSAESGVSEAGLQGLLQQRNFLRNVNPRDPLNVNLRKAFLEYDKNLSGTVSKDEIEAVCRNIGVHVDEAELKELTARCDRNGDGQIDYHEFALHLSRRHHPAASECTPTTTTRKHFKPPHKQRLSSMQRLVIEQDHKRFVPLQHTHFFHVDSSDDYLLSTTRKDFVPPEVM